mgnify:CR=1 FL=1
MKIQFSAVHFFCLFLWNIFKYFFLFSPWIKLFLHKVLCIFKNFYLIFFGFRSIKNFQNFCFIVNVRNIFKNMKQIVYFIAIVKATYNNRKLCNFRNFTKACTVKSLPKDSIVRIALPAPPLRGIMQCSWLLSISETSGMWRARESFATKRTSKSLKKVMKIGMSKRLWWFEITRNCFGSLSKFSVEYDNLKFL